MFPCSLSSLASVLILLSSSGAGVPSGASSPTSFSRDPINSIIGNESFRARFGREPGPADDEDLRIAVHLQYVEEMLRSRPVDHLSHELRAGRLRNLDRLRDYHLRVRFPRNYDVAERRPCFIDRNGTICAVGYLVEQSAGLSVARAINSEFQYARIREMRTPVLEAWIARSGLTEEEVATIQPAYDYWREPADHGITLGGGLVVQSDYAPAEVNGLPAASLQSGLGGIVSGGIYLDLPTKVLPKTYLHVRPTVEYRWGGFADEGIPMRATNGIDTFTALPTRFTADYSYAALNMDVLVGYYVGGRVLNSPLQILAGPSVQFGGLIADERQERLEPADAGTDMRLVKNRAGEVTSDDNGRLLRSGGIADVPGFRFGLKGGLRFKDVLGILRAIPCLEADIYASCSLLYRHDLTPLVSGTDWRSHSLQLTLDVSLAGRPDPW